MLKIVRKFIVDDEVWYWSPGFRKSSIWNSDKQTFVVLNNVLSKRKNGCLPTSEEVRQYVKSELIEMPTDLKEDTKVKIGKLYVFRENLDKFRPKFYWLKPNHATLGFPLPEEIHHQITFLRKPVIPIEHWIRPKYKKYYFTIMVAGEVMKIFFNYPNTWHDSFKLFSKENIKNVGNTTYK